MVERDVLLAELTGGRVHIAHLSARGLAWTRCAAARRAACGSPPRSTPHHLLLTDEAVRETGLRHQHQDEPAAARRRPTARRCSRACATARSTASPPTTRRTPSTTRRSSSTRRRSASSASRPRWPLCLDRLVGPGLVELPAARGAPLDEPGARPRPAGRDARARLARGRHGPRPREAAHGRPDALREPQPQHAVRRAGSLQGWPAVTIVGGRVAWKDARSASSRRGS